MKSMSCAIKVNIRMLKWTCMHGVQGFPKLMNIIGHSLLTSDDLEKAD